MGFIRFICSAFLWLWLIQSHQNTLPSAAIGVLVFLAFCIQYNEQLLQNVRFPRNNLNFLNALRRMPSTLHSLASFRYRRGQARGEHWQCCSENRKTVMMGYGRINKQDTDLQEYWVAESTYDVWWKGRSTLDLILYDVYNVCFAFTVQSE